MWRCHKRGQDESNFIAFAFNGRKRANIIARPNARNVSEGKYWITLSARRALWCCTHSHHTLTTCLLLICLIIIQIFPRFSFFFGVRRFSSLYFAQTFVLVCVFMPYRLFCQLPTHCKTTRESRESIMMTLFRSRHGAKVSHCSHSVARSRERYLHSSVTFKLTCDGRRSEINVLANSPMLTLYLSFDDDRAHDKVYLFDSTIFDGN